MESHECTMAMVLGVASFHTFSLTWTQSPSQELLVAFSLLVSFVSSQQKGNLSSLKQQPT